MTETAMGAAVDLTEATDAARALVLAHTDAPFRQVADHLPIGVFLLDRDRHLVYANQLLHELIGIDAASGFGVRWPESVHPDDRDRVVAVASRVHAHTEARVVDCRIIAAGGSVRRNRDRRRVLHARPRSRARWRRRAGG